MSTVQTSASAQRASASPPSSASDADAKSSDNGSSTLEGLRSHLRQCEDNLAQASTAQARAQKEVEDLQKEIGEIEPVVSSYAEAYPALAKDLKEMDDFVRCKLDALQRDGQTPSDANAIKAIVADASSEIEAKQQEVDKLRGQTCGAKEDCDAQAR
jgi:chromosome segregation ATPase